MIDPASGETAGYHLFVEPPGALAQELAELIRHLAEEYDGPLFTPHVTVLARIPDADEGLLIATTERLAARMAPQTITLGAFESMDTYFKALYRVVEEQESLATCHALAAQEFSMKPTADYRAHLSLLYGNYPEGQAAKIREQLEPPQNTSFRADTLSLYKTHGRPENWHKVQDFRIRG